MEAERAAPLALWGGVECTVNRVQERFHDQLRRCRHLTRPEDINRFAELGISSLRTPVLWEHAVARLGDKPSFEHIDPVLQRTRACGIEVIAGLCHHGSGPLGTHLLDPNFEYRLAAYARDVAEAYPWIAAYTPVNEPLTTARFSTLYGHWYPHARDTPSFLRAVVHQCRATVRAMEEVRKHHPGARLIQTEDIATIRATPSLSYQAEYENHRRFLSLDLLCGRVNGEHPLFVHLLENGISRSEVEWFIEHPCPPDIIGINYYFTSDRFLDENVEAYPAFIQGGNGRARYVDIDAARAGVGVIGHRQVLETVWARYGLPLAITEVHAGCTREEQMRWVHEAWSAACDARRGGVDVRAITAWALLGSFDWNSLVCVEAGLYEPGLFDLRSSPPRQTALANMFRALAHHGHYDHPVLDSEGWWRRLAQKRAPSQKRARPLLITGGGGDLAHALSRGCESRGLEYRVLTRAELDISDRARVRECIAGLSPWAIINAEEVSGLFAPEQHNGDCMRANTEGPMVLASEAAERRCRFLTFSSDLVFDGEQREPYVESDQVAPLCTLGASQARAEQGVLQIAPDALIVRTSGCFGPWDERQLTRALRTLASGRGVYAPVDSVFSPTYLPDLVTACFDLLIDGASEVWHVANVGAATWAHLTRTAARHANLPEHYVREATARGRCVERPLYRVLGSERATLMPVLEDAVLRYLRATGLVEHRS